MELGSLKFNTLVNSIVAASDSITSKFELFTQPFEEVTVTEYVPTELITISAVVCPVDQK
jgi:hypothetical protein